MYIRIIYLESQLVGAVTAARTSRRAPGAPPTDEAAPHRPRPAQESVWDYPRPPRASTWWSATGAWHGARGAIPIPRLHSPRSAITWRFYCAPMDACLVDGEKAHPQPGGFYGGWITNDVVGPFKGEPGTGGC